MLVVIKQNMVKILLTLGSIWDVPVWKESDFGSLSDSKNKAENVLVLYSMVLFGEHAQVNLWEFIKT